MNYIETKEALKEARQDKEALMRTIEHRMYDLIATKKELNSLVDDIVGYFRGVKDEQYKINSLKEKLLELEAINYKN